MHTGMSHTLSFPSATVDHPSGRNLDMSVIHRIVRHVRILCEQCFKLHFRYNRIHKETACIAQYFRIRQLGLPDGNNDPAYILQIYLTSLFLQFRTDISIFQMEDRMLFQPIGYESHCIFSFQFLFEDTFPICITAFLPHEPAFFSGFQSKRIYRNNQILGFHTIGTDILYGRCPDFTGNQ